MDAEQHTVPNKYIFPLGQRLDNCTMNNGKCTPALGGGLALGITFGGSSGYRYKGFGY